MGSLAVHHKKYELHADDEYKDISNHNNNRSTTSMKRDDHGKLLRSKTVFGK
ncbi:hypothetical protein ABLO26_02210 [Neobacillus sp. 179-J 1A1 HS]|uniref:hypothetical protein n=1 Tax=Neobacillus driksii TaxID=3035913 RepID=UPI0035BC4C1C